MNVSRIGTYIWIIIYLGLSYYTLIYLIDDFSPIIICLILILNIYFTISRFIEEIEYQYKRHSLPNLSIDIIELTSVLSEVEMMDIHCSRADEIIDDYVDNINTGKMKMWKIDVVPTGYEEPLITMLLTDNE